MFCKDQSDNQEIFFRFPGHTVYVVLNLCGKSLFCKDRKIIFALYYLKIIRTQIDVNIIFVIFEKEQVTPLLKSH